MYLSFFISPKNGPKSSIYDSSHNYREAVIPFNFDYNIYLLTSSLSTLYPYEYKYIKYINGKPFSMHFVCGHLWIPVSWQMTNHWERLLNFTELHKTLWWANTGPRSYKSWSCTSGIGVGFIVVSWSNKS